METTADFVLFGPVYDTPSKRAFGPPQGERSSARRSPSRGFRLLAIGGIDASQRHARVATRAPTAWRSSAPLLAAPGTGIVTRAFLDTLR